MFRSVCSDRPPVLFRTNYYSIERISHGVTTSCLYLSSMYHIFYWLAKKQITPQILKKTCHRTDFEADLWPETRDFFWPNPLFLCGWCTSCEMTGCTTPYKVDFWKKQIMSEQHLHTEPLRNDDSNQLANYLWSLSDSACLVLIRILGIRWSHGTTRTLPAREPWGWKKNNKQEKVL